VPKAVVPDNPKVAVIDAGWGRNNFKQCLHLREYTWIIGLYLSKPLT
jgi:hypothetical protein